MVQAMDQGYNTECMTLGSGICYRVQSMVLGQVYATTSKIWKYATGLGIWHQVRGTVYLVYSTESVV